MPTVRQAEEVMLSAERLAAKLPRVIPVAFRLEDGRMGPRDAATHWLHSYPAKMFHRIPQVILDRAPKKSNQIILDPFCGSGTVLLEAVLRGHQALGIDVNPLARMISRVKTMPLKGAVCRTHLEQILLAYNVRKRKPASSTALDFWFKSDVRASLEELIRCASRIKDRRYREFFLLTISSIARRSSLADPAIPPPVKMSALRAKTAGARYRRDLERSDAFTKASVLPLFVSAVQQNIKRMEEFSSVNSLGCATVLPARVEAAKTGLRSSSVDLVITSPPYCGAQKYVRSTKLEMMLLGVSEKIIADSDRRSLGTERISVATPLPKRTGTSTVARLYREFATRNPTRARMFLAYVDYLTEFAIELTRVLRPSGEAFVTFGTDRVLGVDVDFASIFAKAAIGSGLFHMTTLVDRIPSRGMITSRHASASTITDERVVWLRH